MLTAALEDIPRSQFNHSFDYEHQLVRRLQSGGQASTQSVSCLSEGQAYATDLQQGEG